ncbi:uncharacterized protein N7469_000693 [Penicillium citrinum]|uniref:Uncharacterized protein n=2 Tax=Penicillium TaxID=5073 RepID=A0A9W9TUZ0_PENCI|nr:uncharacterized protein N7469_000693 [Penicillium citrinum]KAJ5242366.1 hypothetical protein N7469_000693 [Penicillium citrinum]KAJ5600133.1 hypothetical protein N7450_001200 [Penicillium hetheringtonii]KAK5806969.1 hypothetical protein VI817_001227 [Penicillium citrinum]
MSMFVESVLPIHWLSLDRLTRCVKGAELGRAMQPEQQQQSIARTSHQPSAITIAAQSSLF